MGTFTEAYPYHAGPDNTNEGTDWTIWRLTNLKTDEGVPGRDLIRGWCVQEGWLSEADIDNECRRLDG